MKQIRCHDLRHTAATLALKAGRNPKAVAEQLGHSVEVLLSIYAHVVPADKRAVANSISDQVFGPTLVAVK